MILKNIIFFICIIYISFIVGVATDKDRSDILINELQIQLNKSIEIQNEIKNEYESQMYEIALNDTAAKEYALKYIQINVLYEFDKTNTTISFFGAKNDIDRIEQGNRFNLTLNEILKSIIN